MNYIVLEGISLYVFLVLVVLLLLIAVASLVCAILLDKRSFVLQMIIESKNDEIKYLVKQNFILRLRGGDFNIDN